MFFRFLMVIPVLILHQHYVPLLTIQFPIQTVTALLNLLQMLHLLVQGETQE